MPCTTQYAKDVSQTESPQLVTYTPPATITVHGDAVLGIAGQVVDATRDYVRCLTQRG